MNHKNNIEILLVEDNQDDADLVIRVLKKNNIANNLLHLEDGAAALDYLFSPERSTLPKLILLDLKMPKLSGIEVLRVIKSSEQTKNIPVVMLTSSKEDRDIKKCYHLGVNSYIVKPVEFAAFEKAISNLGIYWMLTNQGPC